MNADPNILVPLVSTRTEFEAQTIAEALRSRGIPSEVFGLSSAVGQWEFGINNDFKVMVRRADLEAAGRTLANVRDEAAKNDATDP